MTSCYASVWSTNTSDNWTLQTNATICKSVVFLVTGGRDGISKWQGIVVRHTSVCWIVKDDAPARGTAQKLSKALCARTSGNVFGPAVCPQGARCMLQTARPGGVHDQGAKGWHNEAVAGRVCAPARHAPSGTRWGMSPPGVAGCVHPFASSCIRSRGEAADTILVIDNDHAVWNLLLRW